MTTTGIHLPSKKAIGCFVVVIEKSIQRANANIFVSTIGTVLCSFLAFGHRTSLNFHRWKMRKTLVLADKLLWPPSKKPRGSSHKFLKHYYSFSAIEEICRNNIYSYSSFPVYFLRALLVAGRFLLLWGLAGWPGSWKRSLLALD